MPYGDPRTDRSILDTDKALVRAQDMLIALSKPGHAAKFAAYIESTHKLIEGLLEESRKLSAELEGRGPPS
jgi:hypothetical protein